MTRSFVTADIHGAWKALVQCLERASFRKEEDRLICLGDSCDGWPQVYEVVEELLQVKKLVYLLGNHDQWALEWSKTGRMEDIWLYQGGMATVESYGSCMPDSHREFFERALPYFIENNRLFVHGGLDPEVHPGKQDLHTLLWDRSLVRVAMARQMMGMTDPVTPYEEVYIGHTPTQTYGYEFPLKICECWMMDTGAGWNGRLSLMDVNSKEVFQSDPVAELYPERKGRM